MTAVYIVCSVILVTAALMALSRIERGPSMFDRILGVDVTTAVLIGVVVIVAAATKRSDLVPVLVVLAVVGFIGAVTIARFAAAESAEERKILTREELAQVLAERKALADDAPGVHDTDDDDGSGPVIVSVDDADQADVEDRGEGR